MLTTRDPRVDPKPGDIISRDFATALHGCIIRDVDDVRGEGGFIFCRSDNGHVSKPMIVPRAKWQKWAKKAEVIHAAE